MDEAHGAYHGEATVLGDIHSDLHLQRQGREAELDWANGERCKKADV
jgi:hypothetical protein